MKTIVGIISFLMIISFFTVKAKGSNYKTYYCADTIGPRIEFSIPDFESSNIEKEFSFKLFELQDRNTFTIKKGWIQKKKRNNNSNYMYYDAYFFLKNEKLDKRYIRFYPPSSLMIETNKSSFISLACRKT